MWTAIAKGDARAVKSLLDSGVNPNLHRQFVSLLDSAIERGNLEICALLIDAGASLQPGISSWPLKVAIQENRPEAVRLLVARGADVDAVSETGDPSLTLAAGLNHPQLIELLLTLGARKNPEALSRAIVAEARESVEILLRHGWDPDAPDPQGDAPLHAAVLTGSAPLLQLLLERGAKIEGRDAEGRTPLIRAAAEGQRALIPVLLKAGAAVNAKDDAGRTALQSAGGDEREAIVALIKRAGGKVFEPSLTEAIRQGDSRSVRALLEKGENANQRDVQGRTPLFEAVRSPEIAVVKALLEKGADPNASDSKGVPVVGAARDAGRRDYVDLLIAHGAVAPDFALIDAAKEGDIPAMERALEQGADLNARDEDQVPILLRLMDSLLGPATEPIKLLIGRGARIDVRTSLGHAPLHLAAMHGDAVIAALLLDRGADINARTQVGETPLMVANPRADELIRLLVKRGADVSARSNDGDTALTELAGGAKAAIVRVLLDGGAERDINAQNQHGRTPLYQAASQANPEVVKLLLERGAKANVLDAESGNTTLIAAIESDRSDIELREGRDVRGSPFRLKTVQLLLKAGADPNAPNGEGKLPLQLARRQGDSALAQALMQGGARAPSAGTSPRKQPASEQLVRAVQRRDPEAVSRLLKAGANPNATEDFGYSVLHRAAENGDLDLVRLLLERGANPNFHPQFGGIDTPSPLHGATEHGRLEIARLLLQHGAKVDARWAGQTPLYDAVRNSQEEMVQLLLSSGATLDAAGILGAPLLHLAAMGGTPSLCRMLLEKGAKIDDTSYRSLTPLMAAAEAGNSETLGFLLKAGADPKAATREGDTALILAVRRGAVDCVKALIAAGADLNARNGANQTPLSVAQDLGRKVIIDLLIRSGAKP